MLLLIHCHCCSHCGRFCVCSLQSFVSNHLDREETIDCLAIIVFLMFSFGCCCYVALPHGVMGVSAVCDCGIV